MATAMAAWASKLIRYRHPMKKAATCGLLFLAICPKLGRKDRPDSADLAREISMRAPFIFAGLIVASTGLAYGQMKLSPKAAPAANETRYFTALDGLMDGNADVILKETRQGKTVTAATLDVCYPTAKGSDRKDRFVVNLAINGQA